jgi:hypothetical protein
MVNKLKNGAEVVSDPNETQLLGAAERASLVLFL